MYKSKLLFYSYSIPSAVRSTQQSSWRPSFWLSCCSSPSCLQCPVIQRKAVSRGMDMQHVSA